MLAQDKKFIVENIGEILEENVKGQSHVIPRISKVLQRGEWKITADGRPKGNFLFLGPTGTGKTEITKGFTKALLGDVDKMIRFDMSEYQNKSDLPSLIGDSSGWNGRLGEALLENTSKEGVILFDEMEKAHKDILDIFLQIMDDARITTGNGVLHDLSEYYIVLTSNIGSSKIMHAKKLKWAAIERSVRLSLTQEGFRPEFIGRFNEVVIFNKLSYDTLREIAVLNINKEIKRLNKHFQSKGYDILLEATPELVENAVMYGSDQKLGARPMRNYVEKALQEAVVKVLIDNEVPTGKITIEGSAFHMEDSVDQMVEVD